MEVTYASTQRMMQQAPRISRKMEFHSRTTRRGEGGRRTVYNDSKRIDMLGVPLNPPREDGRE